MDTAARATGPKKKPHINNDCNTILLIICYGYLVPTRAGRYAIIMHNISQCEYDISGLIYGIPVNNYIKVKNFLRAELP